MSSVSHTHTCCTRTTCSSLSHTHLLQTHREHRHTVTTTALTRDTRAGTPVHTALAHTHAHSAHVRGALCSACGKKWKTGRGHTRVSPPLTLHWGTHSTWSWQPHRNLHCRWHQPCNPGGPPSLHSTGGTRAPGLLHGRRSGGARQSCQAPTCRHTGRRSAQHQGRGGRCKTPPKAPSHRHSECLQPTARP